jgi:inhibitor of cysteine peptidase
MVLSKEFSMRIYKISVLIILLLITSFLVGCTKTNEILVKADQNEEMVEVQTGDMLVIELPGNPSTGYAWEVENLDTMILEQVGEIEFNQTQSDEPIVGAGGTMIIRLKALTSGETAIKLIYHRSFEKSVDPLDTFFLNVVVK